MPVNDQIINFTDLGVLDPDLTSRNDRIAIAQPNDFFSFTLNEDSLLNLSLTNLSDAAGVEIIIDSSNNGIVDANEILDTIQTDSGEDLTLNLSLTADTYFINVFAPNNDSETNYNLSVSAISEENTPPTTIGIDDLNLATNSPAQTINLFDVFSDAEDANTDLVYEVQNNTNETLFATTPSIDANTGNLTLEFAENITGNAEITIRATDTGDEFVETTFNVTVSEDTTNTPPTTIGIDDLNLATNSPTQTINLFDIFSDAEDLSEELVYTVTNTNETLFTTTPSIDANTGNLTLEFAENITGNAEITIRATDTG
ncbi:MAG: hypothetical protein SAJ37_12045, partial [Oscillatoria sp. PMC 1068.18]|nr:hypothetical protein [Oscillatoria sp. PMC 1076.18]MEC4989473.1 hypothetical protein [Oscillatoria sp. PMC 1068.18]